MSDVGLRMDRHHRDRHHRAARNRRRRRRRRASSFVAVVIALAVLVGAGAFAYMAGRDWLEEAFSPPPDYPGPGEGSVLIEVESGQTSTEIADTLAEEDVVASVDAFMDEARTEEKTALIQAGFYEMKRKMSARGALTVLIDPENIVQDVVTVPEGYIVSETLQRIAKQTDIPLRRLERAAADPARLGLPAYAENELEGFLFPATYPLPPNASAREVLTSMVDRFKQAARDHELEAGADELGLTPREVVTVASIVQAEARRAEDFPKVARVIYNRLEADTRLQMDSTVHYAVGKAGDVATTAADRRSTSRYNTYRVTGLPPGPINSPGEQALTAALEPADGDWMFFVTVNIETGETKFAENEADHARNVEEYRDYCRRSDVC
jgi:UPF0755 protein